jgi:3-hydroxybutyrate dehydrogenase
MSNPGAIRDMVERIGRSSGMVDILVNNAGIQYVAPVEEFPVERWDAILAVNLSAAFHASKAVLPDMKRRGFGRIINIASAHGLIASPFKAAYVAAKHGVVGLTKTAAIEYGDAGIRVNAVCPGFIRTPMTATMTPQRGEAILAQTPMHRMGNPEEIAEMVVWLFSDRASFVSGAAYNVDGGYMAL